MKKSVVLLFLVTLILLFAGCAPKVMVPPIIDLKQYEVVGIVQFKCNSEGRLNNFVTQEFMEEIREDQSGVKIVELGPEEEILQELEQTRLGPDAYQAIGNKYSIKTLIIGNLDVSEPSPDIDFWGSFTSMSVSTEIDAMLTVKLIDIESKATVWTGSSRASREVSDVGIWGNNFHFDAEDPEKAYGKLVEKLVDDVSEDFQNTWTRKR